jgi:hypothetical protein
MSKYDPLQDYLQKQKLREVELSFREIEAIVGFKLPKSADLPQFWANQTGGVRPQRDAWREAGFEAFLIRGSDRVKFRRIQ